MESHQEEDQNNSRLDFYKQDGNLIIFDKIDEKAYTIDGKELDFDVIDKNLTKNEEKKNIKNKIKSDTTMSEEKKEPKKTEDLTEDAKTEIRDGQKVKTEAEGDDDEVEEKIKGDPYQDGDKEKGEKFVKNKKDMMYEKIIEDLSERLKQLESNAKTNEPLLSKIVKSQEAKDVQDLNELKELLQEKPYGVALEKMEDLTLEQLQANKDFLDGTEFIKDFYESDEHLTHDNVNTYAFDMGGEDRIDGKALILEAAQNKFASDFGDQNKTGGAKKE